MRVDSRWIPTAMFVVALLIMPAFLSRPSSAQCGMMGAGGGHDHGAKTESEAKKPTSSEKKLRESVAHLLESEQGRMVLAQVLIQDRDFMWAFIPRIVAVPEWRGLVSLRLTENAPDSTQVPPAAQETAMAVYICPMHPEVTSSKPGSCPKCGMALEPRAPDKSR